MTDPDDGTWDGPSVFPDGCYGHDGDDVSHWEWTTLRVAVEFSAELSEVCNVVGPREGYWESAEAEEDEGC